MMQTNTPERARPPAGEEVSPWWRHPMMWLVVGGPAVVVVAGFITLWLAARAPDPVLIVPKAVVGGEKTATAPAVQARNHAATPKQP